MNLEEWTVDMTVNSLTHSSGFTIRFEGDPLNPSEIHPENVVNGMSAIDQARLLRTGLEFLTRFARSTVWRPTQSVKSETLKACEELAKQFAERPDKPQRAVLSLKK